MTYCGEATAVKHGPGRATAISLRCRAWTCPDCADTRKKGLIAQGIGGRPNKFLTLTMRRTDRMTPEQAAAEITRGWRIVRHRIMRFYGLTKLPFLAVMERHQSGWPHLHILARMPFIDHEMLSEWCWEIFDGPNVWIEHLDRSHKAPIYCAKYCTKCAQKIGTSKRYWQSKDYDLREPFDGRIQDPQDGPWQRTMSDLYEVEQSLWKRGFYVERLSKWKIVAIMPARAPP